MPQPTPPSPPEPAEPEALHRLAATQAATIAVQDAVAHLRAVETLAVAANALALRLAAEGDDPRPARIVELANAAVDHARAHYEAVLRIGRAEVGEAVNEAAG